MNHRLGVRAIGAGLVIAVGLSAAGACGKRGAPQAPLRPIPGPLTDVTIERTGMRVTLAFTVPAANADNSTPSAVDRIDVYAMTRAADAKPPEAAELFTPEHVVAALTIVPEPVEPTPTPDARPRPGSKAIVVDPVKVGTSAAEQVRYYAAVSMSGRRRGQPTPIYAVSLASAPAVPAKVSADHTETAVTLSWPASGASRFIVEETDERGASLTAGLRVPVSEAAFRTDAQFGKRRCFVVRAVEISGAVSIVGAPTAPACLTPIDRYPPPVPTGLQASATDAFIELTWTSVSSADLAGYLVLRAEGANGTLQPLTPAPIADAVYRDRAVRSGVTYAYAIVAVDTASPANRSEPSARQEATARAPRTADHIRVKTAVLFSKR